MVTCMLAWMLHTMRLFYNVARRSVYTIVAPNIALAPAYSCTVYGSFTQSYMYVRTYIGVGRIYTGSEHFQVHTHV